MLVGNLRARLLKHNLVTIGGREYSLPHARAGRKSTTMTVEEFSSIAAVGRRFFVGALIGYALKKVVKILAIVVGFFFAALVYLQYQQIVIDWNKLQPVSQNAAVTVLMHSSTSMGLPMLVAIQQT
jgi:uncharacterized membrane protein (Fun14 family)